MKNKRRNIAIACKMQSYISYKTEYFVPFPSPMHESEKWKWSCSVVSHSLRLHGLQPTMQEYWSGLPLPSLPFLLPPSILPSIRVFSNESALCIRWPKDWSFSFNISPSNEHPGLISFRMDQLDLLSVQGTLKSLLQHHSSKASILWCSAFFIVQLSHRYMTTGKTIDGLCWQSKVSAFEYAI